MLLKDFTIPNEECAQIQALLNHSSINAISHEAQNSIKEIEIPLFLIRCSKTSINKIRTHQGKPITAVYRNQGDAPCLASHKSLIVKM